MSLKENLINFLKDEPKHLTECYEEFKDIKPHSIRARLNENVGKCFKRIKKGIYLAIEGDTQALIIEGDSWQEIKELESGCIDFIITDSPQTTALKWVEMGTTRKKENCLSYDTKDLDTEMYREMFRVLKPAGHIFLFFSVDTEHTIDYNNEQLKTARAQGFIFNKRFIWDKKVIGMGYNGRCKYEQIFFLSKGKRHKPYDLGMADLLSYLRPNPATRRHEAEKPIELIQDLMKIAGKKGDIGLDLFGGSFNFIEAGFRQGINTIAIEKKKEFIEAAVKRFNAILI